jgi:three-Cys-motif partner protein
MGRTSQTAGDDLASPAVGQLTLALGGVTAERSRIKFRAIERPIWTENKARLIERYLYYFVLITKHGTYIDGFAGPQSPDVPEAWSARLVLASEPRWLRKFFLCDLGKHQYEALNQLRFELPPRKPNEPKRTVHIYHADFNDVVDRILGTGSITEREATFCLIDQRTFECKWSTLNRLAAHKRTGQKIELFYFLAARWFGRAFQAVNDRNLIRDWWGRDDWEQLRAMRDHDRADLLCQRFRGDLGYRSAYAWPIFSREDGGRIAYHMIHATDHDAAPLLMARAYRKALTPKEQAVQLDFGFVDLPRGLTSG